MRCLDKIIWRNLIWLNFIHNLYWCVAWLSSFYALMAFPSATDRGGVWRYHIKQTWRQSDKLTLLYDWNVDLKLGNYARCLILNWFVSTVTIPTNLSRMEMIRLLNNILSFSFISFARLNLIKTLLLHFFIRCKGTMYHKTT